jgi:hypothetical protein
LINLVKPSSYGPVYFKATLPCRQKGNPLIRIFSSLSAKGNPRLFLKIKIFTFSKFQKTPRKLSKTIFWKILGKTLVSSKNGKEKFNEIYTEVFIPEGEENAYNNTFGHDLKKKIFFSLT